MIKTIVITGADDNFSDFMMECISSLNNSVAKKFADFGVLDQGLSEQSRFLVTEMGIKIATPEWPPFVPNELKNNNQIGLLNRPYLRDLFPGYDVYIWLDSDSWVQTDEFFDIYVRGAVLDGAAVALENGPGYRKNWREIKWWIGNYVSAYGAMIGTPLSLKNSVNIGVMSLRNNTAHWEAWITQYKRTIESTGKLNLDQHAFHAAIYLTDCDTALLPARMNWLPILSTPLLEGNGKTLKEPGRNGNAISIVHLAGPNKKRVYKLKGNSGISTSLNYDAYRHIIC